jgi:alpha-galactosidase
LLQAPLLLGNDIRKMDTVALGVVMNKDALSISQDALGVQGQRVSTKPAGGSDGGLIAGVSAAAVAATCDRSRPTQVWEDHNGVLTTTDRNGAKWCVEDTEGTETVGSWRGAPCAISIGTVLQVRLAVLI